MKVGDKVNYTGRMSGQPPVQNCTVTGVMKDWQTFFRFPVATVDKVDCWVAISELQALAGEAK